MSEPVDASSVLFGVDGTELPDPAAWSDPTGLPDPPPVLPDPLTGPPRRGWQHSPAAPPPMAPPAVPELHAMREAIVAALGDEPGGSPPSTSPLLGTVSSQAGAAQTGAAQAGSGAHPGGHGPPLSRPLRVPVPTPPAGSPSAGGRSRPGRETRPGDSVRTGCVLVLIIFGVLAAHLIAGLVQSVPALFLWAFQV